MKTYVLNSNKNIEVDTNLIKKIALVVTNCEGNLLIDQLIGPENGEMQLQLQEEAMMLRI